MPLIVMNREMGSLGKDVAYGLATALGLKVQHHEMIDHLANRARVRKSHVISFLEGSQGIIQRLTIDQLKLRVFTADEIVSIAQRNEGVILRGWGATSLFKDVPHVVRICVSASRRQRVKRMMQRMDSSDEGQTERIVDQNDEAARAVMRRHFHIDVRDINEYDLGFNTDRVSVEQCIDQVIRTVNSPQFAESDASRAKLRDLAVMHHVRAALRTQALTSHCIVRVTSVGGQVRLEGVVDNSNEAKACSEIASRIKGVVDVDNRLNLSGVPARLPGG
ncbi:MAG: BON domain-containing protein [Betaproteobacteria bacterium]|nr:BON domain-containing protein [Betaproteobacteria bacterium]